MIPYGPFTCWFSYVLVVAERTLTNWYKEILDSLQSDEKAFIETTNVLEWFIKNASRYDNIRTLKTKLENAVFDKLTEHYILGKYSNDSTI